MATFTTIFLGIFIEAVPFLLAGTLASGLVEAFVKRERLLRLVPSRTLPAALAGSLMGMAFPVCECGVVPLTRRLYAKGLPAPTGIAFLLAAPIVNPVVIAGTLSAYGFGFMLLARVTLGVGIAAVTGVLFALAGPEELFRADLPLSTAPPAGPPEPVLCRLHRALRIAGDEFFEMGRYLVTGAALAALMQTVISQRDLLDAGSGPLISVLLMAALAFVLSICSTVDAFVSLGFAPAFSTGSILAFLVFGPMVDVKSVILFRRLFKPKAIAYLIILPLLMVTLVSVIINLYGEGIL